MNVRDKVLNSFFAAVTPRTAGFNSISTDGMTNAGKFLTMILNVYWRISRINSWRN